MENVENVLPAVVDVLDDVLVEVVVEGVTVHALVKRPLCWKTILMMTTAKFPMENFMSLWTEKI